MKNCPFCAEEIQVRPGAVVGAVAGFVGSVILLRTFAIPSPSPILVLVALAFLGFAIPTWLASKSSAVQ